MEDFALHNEGTGVKDFGFWKSYPKPWLKPLTFFYSKGIVNTIYNNYQTGARQPN